MSADVDALPEMLARLKLTALHDRLDGLLDEAARGGLSLRGTLAPLCRAEVSHREERRIQPGTSIANFPHQRTLEGFDFTAQPSLDVKQVRDLAACRRVANGDALLIQGPLGVGKTHLAVALGHEAIRHGHPVLFTPAAAHLLFQLVSRRYERGSILITSNRAVGDWGTVLGDQVVATAILVVGWRPAGDAGRYEPARRVGLVSGHQHRLLEVSSRPYPGWQSITTGI